MLEIDYNLFPLSEEETEEIGVRAVALARRGKTPPLTPASYGRVVVVNPYEGFTLHHVPDDLRRPLRRALLPSTEASKDLTGSQLRSAILDKSNEPIYEIVIELHSKFSEVVSFLRQIPAIQRQHPKCRIMLHGELIRIHDLLGELLSQPDVSCELLFDHFEGSIALDNADQLGGIIVELPRYPTLPKPFFSTLHIKDGEVAETFGLKDLARLYGMYGIGNIGELDISGKMKAKLVILDIPLSAIEFLRFSESRGEAFHAVNLDGEKVLSSEFADKGLLGRDIPFHALKSVFRKLPHQSVEEIKLDEVRALRVNCFEGHVSFLWKPGPNYTPLYEVKGMRVRFGAGNGAEPETVTIDDTVFTQRGQPRFGDVRAGIRHQYLEHIYKENLGQQLQLQRYASRLKIGCLGPMAAQTIRLLRPYGLGQLIPSESLYYLCDSFDQIPRYYESEKRLQALYDEVLAQIREMFGKDSVNEFRTELIAPRLLVLQGWARGEAPPLDKVNAEHLDTIYKEMRIFLNFTESEFRRVGDGDGSGENIFQKVEQCQQTLLRVRHLANLIGGRYGQLPNRQSFPDFVFFSSDEDTLMNGREFYLPGLSLSGVFSNKNIQRLFHTDDFEFSVFLEEQLSVISYLMTQDFERESDDQFYDIYFEDKLEEAERELRELERTRNMTPDPNSEHYQNAVARMTAKHQAEVQAFRSDRENQTQRLENQETRYFDALKAVNDYLAETGVDPEKLLSGDNYIHEMDRHLMLMSKEMVESFRNLVRENVKKGAAFITDKKESLTSYLLAFSNMQKILFQELQLDYVERLNERVETDLPELLKRLNDVARTGDGNLDSVREHLDKRQALLKSEISAIEDKVNREIAKNQNSMFSLREANRKLVAELSQPIVGPSGGAAKEILATVGARLDYGKAQIMKIVEAAQTSYNTVESLRASYRAKGEKTLAIYFGQNELAMVEERRGRNVWRRLTAGRVDQPLIAPPVLDKSELPGDLPEQLRESVAGWRAAEERLLDFGRRDDNLADMHEGLESYEAFNKIFMNFRRAVREKNSGQHSLSSLANRVGVLDQEADNLSEVVEKQMLPAHASYASRIHIPNIRKRISYFKQAREFVRELKVLSFEDFQREFLDRAIFRRFYATQFRRGAHIGMNSEMPLFTKLGNVNDGIAAFHRVLRVNLANNGYKASEISLTKLPAERLAGILQFIEQQKKMESDRRLNYLILPSTFSLSQALEVIQFKEEHFAGLPQLILMFVSKFDMSQIRDDEALRNRYFLAMKHNIIVNVDDNRVIDNPKAIADRLLQETLGCAHDIKEVEAIAGAITDHRGEPSFPFTKE